MGVSLRSDVTQEGAKSSISPEIDSYSTSAQILLILSLTPLTKGMETVALGSGLSLFVGVGDMRSALRIRGRGYPFR